MPSPILHTSHTLLQKLLHQHRCPQAVAARSMLSFLFLALTSNKNSVLRRTRITHLLHIQTYYKIKIYQKFKTKQNNGYR
jgi:hypothetical protein